MSNPGPAVNTTTNTIPVISEVNTTGALTKLKSPDGNDLTLTNGLSSLLTQGNLIDSNGNALPTYTYDSSGNITDLSGKFPTPSKINNTIVLVGDSVTANNFHASGVASIVIANGTATVRLTNAHTLYAGAPFQLVNIASPTSLNGTWVCSSVINTTAITFAINEQNGTATITGAGDLAFPRCIFLNVMLDIGWFVWGNIFARQKFELLHMAASTGRTTQEMLTRIGEVTSYSPAYAVVSASINDVLNISSAGSITPTTTALTGCYKALHAVGAKVIAGTIIPYGPTGATWSAAGTECILEINEWIRNYCENNTDMILCDFYADMVDPLNSSKKGAGVANYYQSDDLHPNASGGFTMGKTFCNATASIKSSVQLVTSAADNIGVNANNSNILQIGPWTNSGGTTSTGFGGVMPGSMVVERSAGSPTGFGTAPLRPDGFGYDASVTVAGAANNDGVNLRAAGGSLSNMVANTNYRFEADVTVAGLASSNYKVFFHNISGTMDGVSSTYFSATLYPTAQSGTMPIQDWNGVLRTPWSKFSGTFASANTFTNMQFAGAGAPAQFNVGRMSIRKQT